MLQSNQWKFFPYKLSTLYIHCVTLTVIDVNNLYSDIPINVTRETHLND